MAGAFGQLGDQVKSVFRRLSIGQKVGLILVILIALGGIVGVVQWAGSPSFVQLFSNLPAEEAGRIVDWLSENKIAYKLEQGGSRILIPKDKVYDARIRLAQEGLPSSRSTGYEIFDETNLGMSEFVQKLNYRRALEGELSRTIEELDEVNSARVHIVIPEPALFREKEKPTTASIALRLKGTLNERQTVGISHLVASAVEGLEVENVTIVDSRGNVLTDFDSRDPLMALSSTQLELKERVEERMNNKVASMLESLLGPDKSIVRISADLDFSRSEVTSEQYDPESAAIRSEETIETTQTETEQDQPNPTDPNLPPLGKTASTSEANAITNYEISKTMSHTVSNTGGIKRISASVLVDGSYESIVADDGTITEEYTPRTADELDRITIAVRNALGIDEQRGDQLSVQNVAFQAPRIDFIAEGGILDWFKRNWYSILQQLLMIAAVIGILMYIHNLVRKSAQAQQVYQERRLAMLPGARGALPSAEGEAAGRLALPEIDSETPQEVLEANQLQERLVEFVEDKPETAARLLKTWLVGG